MFRRKKKQILKQIMDWFDCSPQESEIVISEQCVDRLLAALKLADLRLPIPRTWPPPGRHTGVAFLTNDLVFDDACTTQIVLRNTKFNPRETLSHLNQMEHDDLEF